MSKLTKCQELIDLLLTNRDFLSSVKGNIENIYKYEQTGQKYLLEIEKSMLEYYTKQALYKTNEGTESFLNYIQRVYNTKGMQNAIELYRNIEKIDVDLPDGIDKLLIEKINVADSYRGIDNEVIQKTLGDINGVDVQKYIDIYNKEKKENLDELLKDNIKKGKEQAIANKNIAKEQRIREKETKEFEKLSTIIKEKFLTDVIVDKDKFDEGLSQSSYQYKKEGGIVYGYEKGGNIYINPDIIQTNTLVHEATHLWYTIASKHNPALTKKWGDILAEAIKSDDSIKSLYEQVKKQYSLEGKALEDEMLSQMSERQFLDTLSRDNKTLFSKIKDFLDEVYKSFVSIIKGKSLLELNTSLLQDITIEDFVKLVNRDILDQKVSLTSIEANNTVVGRNMSQINNASTQIKGESENIRFSVGSDVSEKGKKLGFTNRWDEKIFEDKKDIRAESSGNRETFMNKLSERNKNTIQQARDGKYTIQDIDNNFIEFERGIARQQGIDIGDVGEQQLSAIKKTHQDSLDSWIDYLENNTDYSEGFKFHVLENILNRVKVGNKIMKRTNTTVTGYMPLDANALSKYANEGRGDFFNEYSDMLNKITSERANYEASIKKGDIDGKWIKYNKGSDGKELSSLVSNTPRCTASESTAKSQLGLGDFYVFVTKDSEGSYRIPRIAIRTEDGVIREVRGVYDTSQNIEPDFVEIAREKYTTMPGGDKYDKKDSDMKKLTIIETKHNNGDDLSKDELEFLYERGNTIEGFGYSKDARIEEIISQRDLKKDVSTIYGVKEDKIAIGNDDFDKEKHEVILNITEGFGDNIGKLRHVFGGAYFDGSQITDLGNLQTIGGYAYFDGSQITDLGNLQTIGGYADFRGSKITDLGDLQTIGGYADFEGSKITDIGNLQSIGGGAYFNLSQITDLGNLQTIGLGADFRGSKITDLGDLQTIGGYADFRGSKITDIGNLQSIGGGADFDGSQITDLGNLQTIGGGAYFNGSKITDLGNLQSIGGDADFDGSQITDLGNLQTIGGDIIGKNKISDKARLLKNNNINTTDKLDIRLSQPLLDTSDITETSFVDDFVSFISNTENQDYGKIAEFLLQAKKLGNNDIEKIKAFIADKKGLSGVETILNGINNEGIKDGDSLNKYLVDKLPKKEPKEAKSKTKAKTPLLSIIGNPEGGDKKNIVFLNTDTIYNQQSQDTKVYSELYEKLQGRNRANVGSDIPEIQYTYDFKPENDTIYIVSNSSRAELVKSNKNVKNKYNIRGPEFGQTTFSFARDNDWNLYIQSSNKKQLDRYIKSHGIKTSDVVDTDIDAALDSFVDRAYPGSEAEAKEAYKKIIDEGILPNEQIKESMISGIDRYKEFVDIDEVLDNKTTQSMRDELLEQGIDTKYIDDANISDMYIGHFYPESLTSTNYPIISDSILLKQYKFLQEAKKRGYNIASDTFFELARKKEVGLENGDINQKIISSSIPKNQEKNSNTIANELNTLWRETEGSTQKTSPQTRGKRWAYVKIPDEIISLTSEKVSDGTLRSDIDIDMQSYQSLWDQYYKQAEKTLDNFSRSTQNKYNMEVALHKFHDYMSGKYGKENTKQFSNIPYTLERILTENDLSIARQTDRVGGIFDTLYEKSLGMSKTDLGTYIIPERSALYKLSKGSQVSDILEGINISSLDDKGVKELYNVLNLLDTGLQNRTNKYYQYRESIMPGFSNIIQKYKVVDTDPGALGFHYLPKYLAETTVEGVDFADDKQIKKNIFEQITKEVQDGTMTEQRLDSIVSSYTSDVQKEEYKRLFKPYLYLYTPPKEVLDEIGGTIQLTPEQKRISDSIFINGNKGYKPLTDYLSDEGNDFFPNILPPNTKTVKPNTEVEQLFKKNEADYLEQLDLVKQGNQEMQDALNKLIIGDARSLLNRRGMNSVIDLYTRTDAKSKQALDAMEYLQSTKDLGDRKKFMSYYDTYINLFNSNSLDTVNITNEDKVIASHAKSLAEYFTVLRKSNITNDVQLKEAIESSYQQINDKISNTKINRLKNSIKFGNLLSVVGIDTGSKAKTFFNVSNEADIDYASKRQYIKDIFGISNDADSAILADALLGAKHGPYEIFEKFLKDMGISTKILGPVGSSLSWTSKVSKSILGLLSYASRPVLTSQFGGYITKKQSNKTLLLEKLIGNVTLPEEINKAKKFMQDSGIDYGISDLLTAKNKGQFWKAVQERVELASNGVNNIADMMFAQSLKTEHFLLAVHNNGLSMDQLSRFLKSDNIPQSRKETLLSKIVAESKYTYENDMGMPGSAIDRISFGSALGNSAYIALSTVFGFRSLRGDNVAKQIVQNTLWTANMARYLTEQGFSAEARNNVVEYIKQNTGYKIFMEHMYQSIVNATKMRRIQQGDEESEGTTDDLGEALKFFNIYTAGLQSGSFWRLFGRPIEALGDGKGYNIAGKSFADAFGSAFAQYKVVESTLNVLTAGAKYGPKAGFDTLQNEIQRLGEGALNYMVDDFTNKISNTYIQKTESFLPFLGMGHSSERDFVSQKVFEGKTIEDVFFNAIMRATLNRFGVYYKEDEGLYVDRQKRIGTEKGVANILSQTTFFKNILENGTLDINKLPKDKRDLLIETIGSQALGGKLTNPSTKLKNELAFYFGESTAKNGDKTMQDLFKYISGNEGDEMLRQTYDKMISDDTTGKFESTAIDFRQKTIDLGYNTPLLSKNLLENKMYYEYKSWEESRKQAVKKYNKANGLKKDDAILLTKKEQDEKKKELHEKYFTQLVKFDKPGYENAIINISVEESKDKLKELGYMEGNEKEGYKLKGKFKYALERVIDIQETLKDGGIDDVKVLNNYTNNVIAFAGTSISDEAKVGLMGEIADFIRVNNKLTDIDKNTALTLLFKANKGLIFEGDKIIELYGEDVYNSVVSQFWGTYQDSKQIAEDIIAEQDRDISSGGGRGGRGGRSAKDILKLANNIKGMKDIIDSNISKFAGVDIPPIIKPVGDVFTKQGANSVFKNNGIASSLSRVYFYDNDSKISNKKDIKRITKIKTSKPKGAKKQN